MAAGLVLVGVLVAILHSALVSPPLTRPAASLVTTAEFVDNDHVRTATHAGTLSFVGLG